MADDADRAQEAQEREEARNARPRYELPAGKAGDCDLCGECSPRLIDGACGACRDKYKPVNVTGKVYPGVSPR